MSEMNRQEFLRAATLASAVAMTGVTQNLSAQNTTSTKPYDLVAAMGGEPVAMFEAAIKEIGGMGRFVKKGQKVTVKPNIGWDRKPEQAANTNPELIAAIVKSCLAAGASQVTVFDHTCDEWKKCYATSGIPEAAEAAGAKVMPGNDASYYREVDVPQGKVLKKAMVHQAILDSDVWINVPVLKHHGGANITSAMKNLMGIVLDRRFFHSNDLNQCIADICTLEPRAALHIVDAYRIMKANGPQSRSDADVATPKGLFMSTDPVAVDTASIRFFSQVREMAVESAGYLALGQDLGLGTTDLNSLNIKRIKM